MKYAVFALMILLWAALPARAETCRQLKDGKTDIVIDLQTPPPVFDFTKSRKELNRDQTRNHEEWLKKNNMQSVWKASQMETAGLASGGVALYSDYKMSGKYKDTWGLGACAYFNRIQVAMMYRTIIYIPKEFKAGSCAHNDILKHEMRHHQTNVAIVQKAVAKLKQDLPKIIYMMEGGNSIKPSHMEITIKSMKDQLQAALDIYLVDTIEKEMKAQNALIDSPEEYKRGSETLAACGVDKM